MAVKNLQNPPPAYVETVEEIMRIYRSLPPRPTVEEVEAAVTVLKSVNSEEEFKLDEISKLQKSQDVPEEIFSVSKAVKKNMVLLQSHEQRREALHLVDLDKLFDNLDQLIQKASLLVFGDTNDQEQVDLGGTGSKSERKTVAVISDESLLIKKNKDEGLKQDASKDLVRSSSARSGLFSGSQDTGKYSLMKVAGIIELSAKSGAGVLDLQGKLMDQIEWLPVSLGKLSGITELNISDNRIMALPTTIGSLKALTKFDAHSNQLINLPDSFGELTNLVDLDLHNNRLKSLPASFGNLINLMNLDLSSNYFTLLPETLGSLISLKTLSVETNELEELPYTIGSCSALVELRLDFNQLRALPEAIGKLGCLEVIKLHYNRIKGLPTTIGNLSKLRELDVSFNELELVPENLCFVTNLVKLNVSNNFADLTALPRSIGNLEMLEELDISNNQIRFLPESFRVLSNLRVFHADGTPLEIPPRQVTKLGAQAVVQYMADLITMKDVKAKPAQKKNLWYWFCSLFRPRKRSSTEALDS
ncbi:hypothetical protein IFM89_003647 [Coptis chinensis]|uniref:Disease resistance R13L4/SHOC-2-like LRR domain-containing protein n=1 Tax=Coptis chinensis TaxID=261450 RepID=A0A835ITM8_9MAGN|nr:hypothetical protein IFM89_003647 [Coptis chinensis]